MNVKGLSDKALHNNLLVLKSRESKIVAFIVEHLEEVYRRRLYSDFKCSSIYDYCIRILKYSNGEAHRKISACKLASKCDTVKSAIADGSLTLANAASVQVFVNQTKIDAPSVVRRILGKSSKECDVELESIAKENNVASPAKHPTRRRSGPHTMLKIFVDSDALELVKSRLRIKCDQDLVQLLIKEKLESTKPNILVKSNNHKVRSKPRSISLSKRAQVFKHADCKCENCGSEYNLEVDHRISVANGGGNDLGNLRLLCKSCNQRAGIQQLGLPIMDKYLKGNCYSAT